MSAQGDNDAGRVAGSFVFNVKLTDDKTMTFSQYVLADDDVESINKRLDIAAMVVERQRTFAMVPMLEQSLEQAEGQKAFTLQLIDEMKKRDKLSSRDSEALRTHMMNLKRYDLEIAKQRAKLLEVKIQMAGAQATVKAA